MSFSSTYEILRPKYVTYLLVSVAHFYFALEPVL
jgi:hypothetical protein